MGISRQQVKLNSFLSGIGKVTWKNVDGKIFGFKKHAKGVFNPITAVAHSKRLGVYKNNKRDTVIAGKKLGFSTDFCENVFDACQARNNRGYTQILRGQISKGIGVSGS